MLRWVLDNSRREIWRRREQSSIHHCHTQLLNLAVGDAIKNSKLMKEKALEITHEITKLTKKSPKRDAKLQSLKNQSEDDSKTQKITLLCPTRWTVRAKSLNSIISNYSFLQDLWQWSLENCTDTEMKARIWGEGTYMKNFDFVYGVLLGELVLGHSDNLSRTLQDPKLSPVQAQECANKTVETMISIRNDEKYDLFWDLVNKKASNLGANSPTIPRKKRAPARLNEYFGYGPAEL